MRGNYLITIIFILIGTLQFSLSAHPLQTENPHSEDKINYSTRIDTSTVQSSITYQVTEREKNWVFFLFMGLVGGLGLFLLGMYLMGQGMQKCAGNRMRFILGKMAHNRFIATGVGAFITMIIQSSSATVVMLMSFVNSKLMRFEQTTGFILGACIGTTITAQIIAFKITDYALLIIAIGFFIRALSKQQNLQYLGEGILGFGILFFGMGIMSEAMSPLRSYDPFLNILVQLENPIVGIIIGALFTGLIQSSSAAIGIFIVTASQGLLTLEASIPLVLGANIGTVFTAFIASIGSSSETRKVAIAEGMIKLAGVFAIIWWLPSFISLTKEISPSYFEPDGSEFETIATNLPRQIANAHTLFNLLITIMILPFIHQFNAFINIITRKKADEATQASTSKLNDILLHTPSLAITLVKKKVTHMGTLCVKMIDELWLFFNSRNEKNLQTIAALEKELDEQAIETKDYLLAISSKNIPLSRSNEAFEILYVSKEYEQIGDIISTNLLSKAENWLHNPTLQFSEEGKSEISVLFEKSRDQIIRSINAFQYPGIKDAKEIKRKSKNYHKLAVYFEQKHFNRLQKKGEQEIIKSKIHLEITGMLNAIIRHADNIASLIIENNKEEEENLDEKNYSSFKE
jgi:phosphate:Na+ symporter